MNEPLDPAAGSGAPDPYEQGTAYTRPPEDVPARASARYVPPGTEAELIIRRGPNAGARYRLPSEATTTLGRARDCDVTLDDVTVSRHHAAIYHEHGRFLLTESTRVRRFLERRRPHHGRAGQEPHLRGGLRRRAGRRTRTADARTIPLHHRLLRAPNDPGRRHQGEGLTAARARGRVGGRPTVATEEIIRAARDLLPDPGRSITSIAKLLGVSPARLYNHIPEPARLRASAMPRQLDAPAK